MARPSRPQIARAVLACYPASYSEQLGVRSPGTRGGTFRILVMALLMGARIRADVALAGTRALETDLDKAYDEVLSAALRPPAR